MSEESVRVWRPPSRREILLMHGRTPSYAADPSGEYFIGVLTAGTMRARRGRERQVVGAGDLVAWDPSLPHRGAATGGSAWVARLMVLEVPDLRAALNDEGSLVPDVHFPDPMVGDPELAARFLRLHETLAAPASALDTGVQLTEWVHDLAAHSPSVPRSAAARLARDDPALRRACAYLDEHIGANPTLEDLARAAGAGKFRLIRLFRAALGMPPHRYVLARRVKLARRLLERGLSISDVAAAAGFADQSHMYRHFRRSLDITPGQYLARLGLGRSPYEPVETGRAAGD